MNESTAISDLSDAEALHRLSQAAVLCVGDVMLDRFIVGRVERISPEAPIPVLQIRSEQSMLGGAGNVVRNLTALGTDCTFCSVVGGDETGRTVLGLIGGQSGVVPYVSVAKDRQTTIKSRFLAGGQQLLRTDFETVADISDSDATSILETVRGVLPEVGALALSDYGKGVLTPALIAALIGAARDAGKPVVVDPKGRAFERYRGADVITPNRRELADATGLPTNSNETVIAAARKIIADHGIGSVLATRSEDGMSLVTADGVLHLAAEAREVFDVSGAGDTVVAVLTAGLAAGLLPEHAAKLANAAAGVVVGKVGTAAAHPPEILEALNRTPNHAGDTKVMAVERALERIAAWRRQGFRIGFTNGCFDLVHPGHISLLSQARAACDRLIVGLNSDDSVRRLKGPLRPVQSLEARSAVLAALSPVDMVVSFSEDTPVNLIAAIRPDVLVKGKDYAIDQVVGGDLVRSWGGRVYLAELMGGHSTTNIVARSQAKAG